MDGRKMERPRIERRALRDSGFYLPSDETAYHVRFTHLPLEEAIDAVCALVPRLVKELTAPDELVVGYLMGPLTSGDSVPAFEAIFDFDYTVPCHIPEFGYYTKDKVGMRDGVNYGRGYSCIKIAFECTHEILTKLLGIEDLWWGIQTWIGLAWVKEAELETTLKYNFFSGCPRSDAILSFANSLFVIGNDCDHFWLYSRDAERIESLLDRMDSI